MVEEVSHYTANGEFVFNVILYFIWQREVFFIILQDTWSVWTLKFLLEKNKLKSIRFLQL